MIQNEMAAQSAGSTGSSTSTQAPLSRIQKWLSDERVPLRVIFVCALIGIAIAVVLVWLHETLCKDSSARICVASTPFPWATLAAVVAAPCVLLTWYWRILHKWRDIQNATVSSGAAIQSNETDVEKLSLNRFKEGIDMLDGKSMSVFGGIHGLKSLCNDRPHLRGLVIDVLESYIRLNGRQTGLPSSATGEGAVTQTQSATPQRANDASMMHLRLAIVTLRSILHKEGLLPVAPSTEERPHVPGSLSKADLSGADLSGLDLSGLDFRRATLVGVNLYGSRMEGANFQNADLTRANLSLSNLGGATLKEAILTHAVCVKTDFTKAHADRAMLFKTNLDFATVDGARFGGARKAGVSEKEVNWALASSSPDPDLVDVLKGQRAYIDETPTPGPVGSAGPP